MKTRFTLSTLCLALAACASSRPAAAQSVAITDLNTGWQFLEEGTAAKREIQVPGTCRLPGENGPVFGTYTRTLQIPASYAGRQLWAEFDGVAGEAEVSAGPDTQHLHIAGAKHSGLTPFYVNISGLIRPGSAGVLQLKLHTGAGPGLAGVIRRVHLAAAKPDGIAGQEVTVLRSTGAGRSVQPAALAVNLGSAERKVTLHAAFGGGSRYSPVSDVVTVLKPGEAKWVKFSSVKWLAPADTDWKPNFPYSTAYKPQLHTITVSTGAEATTRSFAYSAVIASPTGIKSAGAAVPLQADVLNEAAFDQPVYAQNASFMPDGFKQVLKQYQLLGINALCFVSTPATNEMLEACDRAGMLVVQAADFGSSADAEQAVYESAVHPSVVMWHASEATSRAVYSAVSANAYGRCLLGAQGISGAMQVSNVLAGSTARVSGPVWIQAPPMRTLPEAPAQLIASIRFQRAAGSPALFLEGLALGAPGLIPGLATATPARVQGKSASQQPAAISAGAAASLKHSLAQIAAFDLDQCQLNVHSNGRGDWPTTSLVQTGGTTVKRRFLVFNDSLPGTDLKLLVLPTQQNSPTDVVALPESSINLKALPGGFTEVTVPIMAPIVPRATAVSLQIAVYKAGKERFKETLPLVVMPRAGTIASVKYLGLDTQTGGDWVNAAGKRVYGQQAFFIAIRGGRTLYQDPDLYLRRVPAIIPEDRFRGDVHDDAADTEIEFQTTETTNDPRVLWTAPDRLVKHPVAFYGVNGKLFFRADCADGAAHILSLYILDFARPGVSFDIEVFDAQAHLLESRRLDGKALDGGAYVRFEIKGSVYVSLTSLSKFFPATCGLFLDPVSNDQK